MLKYLCSLVVPFVVVGAMLTLSTTAAHAQITQASTKSSAVTKRPISEATGAGTTGHIAKWTDTAGALSDSIIYEQNGWIGINGVPTSMFHIVGTATQDVFGGMGPDTIQGPAMNFGYSGNSFGRSSGFFNVRADSLAVAPNP